MNNEMHTLLHSEIIIILKLLTPHSLKVSNNASTEPLR